MRLSRLVKYVPMACCSRREGISTFFDSNSTLVIPFIDVP